MKVDSKIMYEIWLLSVWNKKPDDCMRYDNAPYSCVFFKTYWLDGAFTKCENAVSFALKLQ